MKKSISLFLLFAMLPNIAFAQNISSENNSSESETIISEDVNILDAIHFGDFFFSLQDESAVTFSELQKAIEHKKVLSEDMEDTTNSRPMLVSREFALYFILQNTGITLSRQDIPYIKEKFEDVHNDSFFAPYILFAKKTGIISGYENNEFRPKHFLSQKELRSIIHNIFEMKADIIQKEYESLRQNEENLVLSSASESESINDTLSDIYKKIKNVELYDGSAIYAQGAHTDIIYLSDEKNLALSQKDAKLNEYTLYFDYNGLPFLAKNLQKLSHQWISQAMIAHVNAYRFRYGLSPLKYNSKLDTTAQQYAELLFESRHFEHRDEEGKRVGDRVLENGYNYQYAVENLGKWQKDIATVMNDWKNSPTHNKNLLNPRVTEVGVGFYGNYWVQIFATEMK